MRTVCFYEEHVYEIIQVQGFVIKKQNTSKKMLKFQIKKNL